MDNDVCLSPSKTIHLYKSMQFFCPIYWKLNMSYRTFNEPYFFENIW